MKRIYDFSSFSRLYEEEESGKVSDFQNLIQMTLANILDCYKRQTSMTKNPYDSKIMGDYDAVAAAPGVDSFKKILDNVKSSAADDAKKAGEAWRKAADAFLGVLSKVYELMPNNKEAIDKIVSEYVKKGKESLASASKENETKSALQKALSDQKEKNESEEYLYGESIFEGDLDFLKGKKGKLKDISRQITTVDSTLKDLEAIDFLKDEAAKQRGELDKISSEVVKMFGMKNRDIEEDKIEEFATKMSEIVSKLADKQKELASQNETTKEAALLFAKATQDFSNASKEDAEYRAKKETEKAEGEKKKEGEEDSKFEKEKKDIGFKSTIKQNEVKGKKDDTVAELQRTIKNKFEKKLKDSESFKTFSTGKYAGDGYFGDNTAKVIKGIKAGFGMKDDTSDITEELIDRILSLKESQRFEFGRFKSFGSFEAINEGRYKDVKFDVDKFLEVADGKKSDKKTPSYEEVIDALKKEDEGMSKVIKAGAEKIASKDYSPSEDGKEIFKSASGISWDEYSKLDDKTRKEIAEKVVDKLGRRLGFTYGEGIADYLKDVKKEK